jgi:hypothetical protein
MKYTVSLLGPGLVQNTKGRGHKASDRGGKDRRAKKGTGLLQRQDRRTWTEKLEAMTHEGWRQLDLIRVNVPWLSILDCDATRRLTI